MQIAEWGCVCANLIMWGMGICVNVSTPQLTAQVMMVVTTTRAGMEVVARTPPLGYSVTVHMVLRGRFVNKGVKITT